MATVPGVTPSERYLGQLSRRTFLRLWSHSGLFRDQGTSSRGGEGAELCDLLVVFGSHVIIFSDKDCAFQEGLDAELVWARWFKSAISKSAKQVWGAERWLKEHPERVFVDRACRQRLPLRIPNPSVATYHRIVVAHDASGARKKMTGGSGSLMIDLRLVEDDHYRSKSDGGHPFAVGHLSKTLGYVHVLDDVTLDIVMRALDTVTDFVGYLTAKEELIRLGRVVGAFGEEELLGHYLSHADDAGHHTFKLPEAGAGIVFDDSHWRGLRDRPEYLRKLEADQISYFWDQVIETVAGHFLDGTLTVTASATELTPERLLRVMASESRLRRRLLSKSLREIILGADHPMRRRIRMSKPTRPGEPHYVFVAWGPWPSNPNDAQMERYRQYRREVLGDYCWCLAARLDEPGLVIGLATEGRDSDGRSWDNVLIDSSDLADENREEAGRISEEEGWFKHLFKVEGSEDEYPREDPGPRAPSTPRLTSANRNAPCPCGSGKKYKKCHGRWG